MLQNTVFKKNFFVEKKYWNKYIPMDVSVSNNFFNVRPVHYFNDISFTRWPFFIGNAVFFFIFYFLMSFKKFDNTMMLSFISFVLLIFYVYSWFSDMILESVVFGRYNRKIRYIIMYGFFLFIVSEIFLFAGFFWAYFDRMFDTSIYFGGTSLPYGIEPLYKNFKPIYATLVLITSGYCANLGYYYIKYGQWWDAVCFGYTSIAVGIIFLFIQVKEYTTLLFNISDNIYTTSFYMLTGFHGAHVIVGLLFLIFQQERLLKCEITKERHTGYVLAVIYWHFVDWIRIFLFLSVYIFNWNFSYYYMWH